MTATVRKPAVHGDADASNRRAQIVRASARLFHDKGFDATTVRDIAAAVGMQSGSPFYHFGSKHEILLAVMEQGLAHALQQIEQAAASAGSATERLRALVRTQLGLLHETGSEFAGVMLHDWRSLPPEQRCSLYVLQQRCDAVWQRTLQELHAQGRLGVEPGLARLLVLGAINHTVSWFRPSGDAADASAAADPSALLDRLADDTTRLFLHEPGAAPRHDGAPLSLLRNELLELRSALGPAA